MKKQDPKKENPKVLFVDTKKTQLDEAKKNNMLIITK